MHFDLLRDKARTLPKGADPLAVDSLRIWHCGYKSLDSIADFKNLQTLTVATFPDSSFDALSSLKKLRQLRVLHFPKIADLQPLAKLNLRSRAQIAVWAVRHGLAAAV